MIDEIQRFAVNQKSVRNRKELTAGTNLCIFPYREHYIIYLPFDESHIIIVSIIRQVRDIPNIIKQRFNRIKSEVLDIHNKIKNGMIKI